MRFFCCLLLITIFLSCNSTEKEAVEKEAVVYDMYQPSEMSNLMKEMYEFNLKTKQDIIDGNIPDEFPEFFLKIYTAELSEFKSRNETFQAFSKLFIQKQKEIFDTSLTIDVKERFNNAINLCISCHTTECTGPIPKIKKLLIH